jgi:hypothetical protein
VALLPDLVRAPAFLINRWLAPAFKTKNTLFFILFSLLIPSQSFMHAFPTLSINCAALISSALFLPVVQACRPLVVVVDRLRPGQVVARPCRPPMAAAAEALLPRALVVARPRLALAVVLPRRVLVVARPRLAPVAALPRRP